MIRKAYEIDSLICSQCHGKIKIIAFLTDYPVMDKIIHHLKLTFVAERPTASGSPPRTVDGSRGARRVFLKIFMRALSRCKLILFCEPLLAEFIFSSKFKLLWKKRYM